MKMNGKELQKLVRNSSLSVDEILERTGIPKTTFYRLYKYDKDIEDHYVEQLSKAIDVQKSTKLVENIEADYLKQRIKDLEGWLSDVQNTLKTYEYLLFMQAPENPLEIKKRVIPRE